VRKRKVLFDARIFPSKVGGVQTYIEGLAEGFIINDYLGIERHWLVDKSGSDWINGIVPKRDSIIICKTRHAHELPEEDDKKNVLDIGRRRKNLSNLDERLPREPVEVRALNPSLIHFCSQDAFLTNVPSIYHPHDLQHRIFPENFTPEEIDWRESAWKIYAQNSKCVVVGTSHVKADLVRYWDIPQSRIKVIELAPLTTNDMSNSEILWEKPAGEITLVYPSAYYEHKNHLNLLRAIPILLKDFPNLKLRLFGGDFKEDSQVTKTISELGIQEFVVQHGWVTRQQLDTVLSQSDLMIVPSTYESASFPIIEAQMHNIPFICSNITALKAQVGNKDIFFDPYNPEDLAAKAKLILLSQDPLGGKLIKLRNWAQVVDDYYQLYKRVQRSKFFD
jgi:glycosyltransferase involved in cell wall biosynthesis